MNARIELTAMFAPFLSGTVLEEAVSEAYALVLNRGAEAVTEAADWLVTGFDWPPADLPVVEAVRAALRGMANGTLPAPAASVPVPDNAGDEELARLRELERRVTEQLEDFEEGLEEDPGAPAVARNMTALLTKAVRGESR